MPTDPPERHGSSNGFLPRAFGKRLDQLATAGGLPRSLSAVGIPRSDLSALAEEAAVQWTGRFNPPFDAAGTLEVYQCAY